MWLVHWPLMGGLLHLVQRGGDWAGPQPAEAPRNSPPINGQCTNHRIADGPLLCGFNVPIKGLAHKKIINVNKRYSHFVLFTKSLIKMTNVS